MAASQMIHTKNEANLNTQKRVDGVKKNTLSADTPARPLPTRQRFQEITKKIISASSSRSSSDAHLNVPNSKARSTTSTITTKSRRNSLAATAIVACAVNNDANRRHSHHAASSSLTTHDSPHHHPTASNGKLNGVSHPMSTSNKSKYRLSHSTTSGDQSASRKLANTYGETRETQASARNGNAYSAEVHTKGQAGSRDLTSRNRLSELCKDCKKASMMESVCFIANDGRISAATTGAAYARHFHHCNVRGCAANQRYNPSPLPLPKKALLSKRQVPHGHHSTRTSAHTTAGVGDHNGSCCSATSSMQGDKWSTCDSKELGLEGFSPCKESPESRSMHAEKDRQSYEENSHAESVEARSTPPASYVSSDIHDDHDDDDDGDDDDHDDDDDDDAKIFGNRDAIEELNDFKSLFYHGDNEYSCSEDGTELTTTTPNSSIKGAFEDLSNIDIEQSGCDSKASQLGRSTVARMRQKYLESLREQEAETVRLRKQEIMARKQAGDWMLDCHMEEVLHRLAPNGEARVKVLVEAYETVIHHSDSDGSQIHDQDHNFQEQEHGDNLVHR